ncbi:MAG: FAD-dependent monooxygenase [Phycisphaeraceae bacterium]|nr:MAG: FAD-dependent monooxygenase [Phycisphaeraceae bacterium]
MTRHAVIVGNGLAGSLLAVLLADRGWRVSLYERRGDPRARGYQGGRSINLALSARGIAGLAAAGLDGVVRERDMIPMPGRMIHPFAGTPVFQPYSHDPADAINAVSRGGLNLTLITAAGQRPGIGMHFDHPCVDVDPEGGVAVLRGPGGDRVEARGDLVIGADGAFSAVRGVLQRTDRFDYSQTYLGHGYKELHIPPLPGGGFAMEPHALHIWPRGGSMMIALPNRDGSFTCTLFWPFHGDHSFERVRAPEEVRSFFAAQYADAVPRMPTLAEDFAANPTGSLVTVRCWPWHRGRCVLVGDAAHAIVPFYGQGINCGFEDCVCLARALDGSGSVGAALAAYAAERKPQADAIADMALDNFVEMCDLVGRPGFLYRKKVEQALHAAFPERCRPRYNLVSFSTEPYTEAKRRGEELERLIDRVVERVPAGSDDGPGDRWRARVEEAARALMGGGESTVGLGSSGGGDVLFDISPVISGALPVWPGDTPFSREVLLDRERGANITLSTVRSTVHLGSHADGSNHYATAAEGGMGIDAMPIGHYVGPCTVLEVAVGCRGRRVVPEDVPGLAGVRTPRVLLRTGSFPDPGEWNADFAGLSVALIDALAGMGVVTIGVDTPSVDTQDSKDLPAHRAIHGHRIAILEGLVLRGVPEGVYDLCALPLRIKDADGSPVRAVLRAIRGPGGSRE